MPGTDADRNGNGFVCVDETTGNTSDDVDPPNDQHTDANQDGIVCANANGVYVDDRPTDDPYQVSCPPGFLPVPAFQAP